MKKCLGLIVAMLLITGCSGGSKNTVKCSGVENDLDQEVEMTFDSDDELTSFKAELTMDVEDEDAAKEAMEEYEENGDELFNTDQLPDGVDIDLKRDGTKLIMTISAKEGAVDGLGFEDNSKDALIELIEDETDMSCK